MTMAAEVDRMALAIGGVFDAKGRKAMVEYTADLRGDDADEARGDKPFDAESEAFAERKRKLREQMVARANERAANRR